MRRIEHIGDRRRIDCGALGVCVRCPGFGHCRLSPKCTESYAHSAHIHSIVGFLRMHGFRSGWETACKKRAWHEYRHQSHVYEQMDSVVF